MVLLLKAFSTSQHLDIEDISDIEYKWKEENSFRYTPISNNNSIELVKNMIISTEPKVVRRLRTWPKRKKLR